MLVEAFILLQWTKDISNQTAITIFNVPFFNKKTQFKLWKYLKKVVQIIAKFLYWILVRKLRQDEFPSRCRKGLFGLTEPSPVIRICSPRIWMFEWKSQAIIDSGYFHIVAGFIILDKPVIITYNRKFDYIYNVISFLPLYRPNNLSISY